MVDFIDAVVRKDSRLACRVRGAVAAHGGKEKRPESGGREEIDDGPNDFREVRNSPAAYADSDAGARAQARGKIGRTRVRGERRREYRRVLYAGNVDERV